MGTSREVSGPSGTRFTSLGLVDETGSTNRDLLDRARDGESEGAVLVTEHQTAGRGRQGRTWHDEPGSSLLCSVLLWPDLAWAPLIPLITGISVVRAARSFGAGSVEATSIGLKWPNDVLLVPGGGGGERKLAGILAEAASLPAGLAVVVGFGMNVRWDVGPPDEVAERAVDLASVVGDGGPDRIELLHRILVELEAQLIALERGDRMAVLDEYRELCVSIGRDVRLETPGGVLEGKAIAVDDGGGLVIDSGSSTTTVTAGDAHHLG